MDLLVKDVEIVTPSHARGIELAKGDIWIREGIIHQVGGEIAADAQIINGHGMVAVPGMVNAHTHAAMTLFRGFADDLPLNVWLQDKIWPLEAGLEPEDVYWGVKLSLLEMIRGGITTYADMYFFMDEEARAVEETGVRASLSKGLIYSEGKGPDILREGEALVASWQGKADGRITAMFGPHAPYTCPPEFLQEVGVLADEFGVGIHIHVAETRKEVEEIKEQYRCSPVELLEQAGILDRHVLAAHCVHLTEKDIQILSKRGTHVVHNPQSNLKLGSGISPTSALIARNINVSLGTDGAASNNNLDLFEEMRLAALLQKGLLEDPSVLPAEQAFRMATINGAFALGLPDVGRIAPGYKADIVLIDFNKPHLAPKFETTAHIVYAAGAADVDTVIVNGTVLMQDRVMQTLDEEEVIFEASRRAARLAGDR